MRTRKWRWVNRRPAVEGWYAMRVQDEPRHPIMFHLTREHIRQISNRESWLAGVEFSNSSVQWPMEDTDEEDPEPEYVRIPPAPMYAVDVEDADGAAKLLWFSGGLLTGIVIMGVVFFLLMFH